MSVSGRQQTVDPAAIGDDDLPGSSGNVHAGTPQADETRESSTPVLTGNMLREKNNQPPRKDCPVCERGNDRWMVECSRCEVWHHHRCVGTKEKEVQNTTWLCPGCVRHHDEQHRYKNGIPSLRSSARAAREMASLELEQIELNQLKAKAKAQEELACKEAEIKKRFVLQRMEDQISSGSSRKSQSVWEEDVQPSNASDKHVRQPMDPTYVTRQRYEAANQMNLGVTDRHETSPMDPLYVTKCRNEAAKQVNEYSKPEQKPNQFNVHKSSPTTKAIQNAVPGYMRDYVNQPIIPLSESQVLARHALEKIRLPDFDGNENDWPQFITLYNLSTERCGYTDVENMIRVKAALKGKALKAVQGRLFHPSQVSAAIEKLNELYGRPDRIIEGLMESVKNLPIIHENNMEGIVELSQELDHLCGLIETTMMAEHINNPLLLQQIVRKLPGYLRLDWSSNCDVVQKPTLMDLRDWLVPKSRQAARVADLDSRIQNPRQTAHRSFQLRPRKFTVGSHAHTESSESKYTTNTVIKGDCKICSDGVHSADNCKKFAKMKLAERWETIKKYRICGKCLKCHNFRDCRIDKCPIDGCTRYHHRLLHRTLEDTEAKKHIVTTLSHGHKQQRILLRIIPVRLYGPTTSIETFALLDEGSTITLLEEELANTLGLVGPATELCLSWTGDVARTEKDSRRVTVEISASDPTSKRHRLRDVQTVKVLGLPEQTISIEVTDSINNHLSNIDIPRYTNGRPKILIGIQHFQAMLPSEIRMGKPDEPVAVNTPIGWTVYAGNATTSPYVNVHEYERNEGQSLHELVNKYMSLETFGVRPGSMPEGEKTQRAISILKSSKKENGRYTAGLLWQNERVDFPESRSMAMRRLEGFERKLEKNPILKGKVQAIFDEYLRKNYIRKLSVEEINDPCRVWYLPVFSVTNPNKPDKVRLVWDFAAKSNGMCLNDALLTGPDLLTGLPYVLYKFREGKFAITGDVEQMFHQIKIRHEDQNAQRMLWRNCDATVEPTVYAMSVMTFGANCSPTTAQYIKNRNAEEFESMYPRAANALKSNHYVDDYLDSFGTVEEAIKVSQQVRQIHNAAGMKLRNFTSNSDDVLRSIGEQTTTPEKEIDEDSNSMKVLGIMWNTQTDKLKFSVNQKRIANEILNGTRPPTKRELLRIMMSVFDPLGLISSYLVLGKIILQDVWRSAIEWDDPIKNPEHERWLIWIDSMTQLERIAIPRCYALGEMITSRQVHIFVDASERVFAAVAYIRSETRNGVELRLVGSKTRVAPSKPMSIPRLELMAAVLGARLLQSIEEGHRVKFQRRCIWSDSRTVISWLNSEARTYKQFVALRIGEILETTNIKEWNWLSTRDNVADEATKWPMRPLFSNDSRWFNGPDFLYTTESTWPRDNMKAVSPPKEELRVLTHEIFTIKEPTTPKYENFSSWHRLVRVQARVFRVARNWRARVIKAEQITGPLSNNELVEAKQQLLRRVQMDSFKEELIILTRKSGGLIEKGSALYQYTPFINEADGLIRMRGRICEAKMVPYDTRFPVILHKDHKITHLIVDDIHRKFLHHNHETVVSELRGEYVIPTIRRVLRKVRHACAICRNKSAQPVAPMMGSLPVSRLSAFSRPFSYVGVDCFGPIEIKIGRRVEKRWGVLYTCMTIRAIHIEVVPSLSTDSFVMSLKRFIARRGSPLEITSDNGTNFRGATAELGREVAGLDWRRIQEEFSNFKWKFNPPSSPHFGGAWERMIRIVKSNLQEILGNHRPNEEVLMTALLECESIINTRPLTHVPIDDHDAEPLTPNHFLVGPSCGAKPMGNLDNYKDGAITRRMWKTTELFARRFWKRWVKEYLPTLTKRTKWHQPINPIKVGDVVIIVDENNPTKVWPKGIIAEIHTGQDGQVRSAKVRTTSGTYTRPAAKLAVIEVAVDNPPSAVIGVENVVIRNKKPKENGKLNCRQEKSPEATLA